MSKKKKSLIKRGVFSTRIPEFVYNLASGIVTASYTLANEQNQEPKIMEAAITGTTTDGETLTATVSDVKANGPYDITYTYQWYASDNIKGLNRAAISGATSSTYVLTGSEVNKYIDCEITPVPDGGSNSGTRYICRQTSVVSPGSLTLQRTVKVNFGNNSVPTVTGYNAADATTDANNDVLSNLVEDDDTTATTWDLTTKGLWNASASGSTANASTGDLQADIIGYNHNAGANNPKSLGKELSSLNSSRFYTIKIVSVAETETTAYDTFWLCSYLDGDTSEVTVDPVTDGKNNPTVHTIATQIAPTAGGLITLWGREPLSDKIYLSSMIIEEYA